MNGELLTVKAACAEFPNRPALSTVWRWILKGSGGAKLRSVKIGGQRFVPRDAIIEFIEQCTANAVGSDSEDAAPPRTPCARTRAVERAEKELAAAGI